MYCIVIIIDLELLYFRIDEVFEGIYLSVFFYEV